MVKRKCRRIDFAVAQSMAHGMLRDSAAFTSGDRDRFGDAVRRLSPGRGGCYLGWQDHETRRLDVGFFPAAPAVLSVGYAFRPCHSFA
jgi:hypothetical protein